jgi:hypothetical protein
MHCAQVVGISVAALTGGIAPATLGQFKRIVMQAVQILRHSIRQVFGNLAEALRISGLLYILQAGVFVWLGFSAMGTPEGQAEMGMAMMSGDFPWLRLAVALVVSLLASLWIAVGWHRYVLVMERPGVTPPFHGELILSYFWGSLLLGIGVTLVAVVVGMLVGLVLQPFGGSQLSPNGAVVVTVLVIVYSVALTLFYRLSPVLPAAALGQGMSFREAWDRTTGASGTFLQLGAFTVVMALAAGFIGDLLFSTVPILRIAWQFVTTWVFLMVGLSILTTIYGHYVEKRALV